MAKQVTAIDIGTNTVKVAQLEQTASGFRLVNCGVARYPRTHASDEIAEDIIRQSLQRVLAETKIKSKHVNFAIPRHLLTRKRLSDFPPVATDEQIKKMIALQAEAELPFGPGNVIYGYEGIRRTEGRVSVELVAARRDTIEKSVALLKQAGRQPDRIIPSTLATGILVGEQLARNNVEGTTLAVDIGAGKTDVCVLVQNRVVFSRSFPLGGNHLTEAYEQAFNLAFDEAEERKIANRNMMDDSEEASLIRSWANKIATELSRSIQAFKRELMAEGREVINNVWLCGGSAIIRGLDLFLAEALKCPVTLWNPLTVLEPNPAIINDLPEQFQYGFAVPLGIGWSGLTEKTQINLVPLEEKQRKAEVKKNLMTILYAAAALILGAGIFWGAYFTINSREAELKAVDTQLEQTRRAAKRAEKLLINNLATTELLAPRVSVLDVLREVSEKFPDRKQIALTGLSIEKARVTLNFEANSHEHISETIRLLNRSALFDDVKSGQVTSIEKNKKPILQVKIDCRLADNAVQVMASQQELNRMSQLESQLAVTRQTLVPSGKMAMRDGN